MVIMSRYSGLGSLATPHQHPNYTPITPLYNRHKPFEKTAEKEVTTYEDPVRS